jgi:adenine-specific DNA-methyltransferase
MDKRATIRTTGAVYTPPTVASAILEFLTDRLPDRPLQVLEPSVGDGAFLRDWERPSLGPHHYTLVDINETVISELELQLNKPAATFISADFTRFAIDHMREGNEPFDLVIGNPPFIRKHNFSAEFKENLAAFSETFGYPLADLKNSWAAFLVAATQLVSADGIVALILPYELMTVEYGQKLLDYVQPAFRRIDIFISDDKAFREIEQDAVIFVGQKSCPDDQVGIFIRRVASFTDLGLAPAHQIALGAVHRGLELSGFLLPEGALATLREIRSAAARLSDFADSAPGIVSAANLPILKKGSLTGSSPIFSEADFAQLAKREACRFLAIKGDRSELSEKLQAYIAVGEQKGFHLRYKSRHRKRWYEVPVVKVEDGFFFKRSHSIPRVIINAARVHVTDTAYGLRMKEGFSIRGLCFSFYTSLTMLFAELDGRFYGGGVLELSPKEFRGLPIVYYEPSDAEWEAFLASHDAAVGDPNKILDFGDQRLRERGAFTARQLMVLRRAWKIVRAHRMRHGRLSTEI